MLSRLAVVRRFFDCAAHSPTTSAARGHRAILQRINLSLFAVLGELSATADWRALAEGDLALRPRPGLHPDGKAEAAWRARRQAIAP
jgi:hypothetical protein